MVTLSSFFNSASSCLQYGQLGSEKTANWRLPLPCIVFTASCNGNFFQCLEGDEAQVNQLYEKLLRDPRHKDLKILLREPIERVSFGDWEMKFALVDEKVRGLLRDPLGAAVQLDGTEGERRGAGVDEDRHAAGEWRTELVGLAKRRRRIQIRR